MDTATTEIYTLSLHDALPISSVSPARRWNLGAGWRAAGSLSAVAAFFALTALAVSRSEEHTSELQSHSDLVCRLLLEKKKKKTKNISINMNKNKTCIKIKAIK